MLKKCPSCNGNKEVQRKLGIDEAVKLAGEQGFFQTHITEKCNFCSGWGVIEVSGGGAITFGGAVSAIGTGVGSGMPTFSGGMSTVTRQEEYMTVQMNVLTEKYEIFTKEFDEKLDRDIINKYGKISDNDRKIIKQRYLNQFIDNHNMIFNSINKYEFNS